MVYGKEGKLNHYYACDRAMNMKEGKHVVCIEKYEYTTKMTGKEGRKEKTIYV